MPYLGENNNFIDCEVDVPLSYADYYYMEAVLRMKKLKEGEKLF